MNAEQPSTAAGNRAIEVGVVLPRRLTASPADLALVAQEAESLGYHSLWVTEHIAVPLEIGSRYPYSADGRPAFRYDTEWCEAMVTLGYVAALTRRVRLGTSVIPMFTRDPISLAKQAATVDVLSDGRLELGLGAGWMTEEAEVLGHPHDHRGQRLDEAIEIMRRAWTEPHFQHRGRFWQLPDLGVHPQPPQGAELPIWIGGTSPAALRTTAERARGNIAWLAEPEEVATLRRRLDALNPRAALAVSMRLEMDRDGVAERAAELGRAGASLLLLVSNEDAAAVVEDLTAFAERVRPALG